MDAEPDPVTAPAPVATDEEVADQWVRDALAAWLAGFERPFQAACPAGAPQPMAVASSDERVSACMVEIPGQWAVRVLNHTDVPLSVWGQDADFPFTVNPQSSFDSPLLNALPGSWLTYDFDTVGGVTQAVMDELDGVATDQRMRGYGWTTCVAAPDANCVVNEVLDLLPQRITVAGRTIPLESIVTALNLGVQNADLIASLTDDWTNAPPGTLTFVQ